MPFQNNPAATTLAPAVAGDFASHNPRFTVDAGPGGIVAGPSGVLVGRFAWLLASLIDPDNAPIIANNFGNGAVGGFIGRAMQGFNTIYLSDSTMLIPGGFMTTVFSGGDFWAKNDGTAEATVGMKAYANFSNGAVTFAATGSPNATAFTGGIAAETASATAVIVGNVMTTSGAVTGTFYPGSVLTGGTVASGTTIVAQLSGTTGGAGTYSVSIPEQNVASATLTASYGLLTVSAVASGTLGVGQLITTGASTGTYITALGTGAGNTGTYAVNLTQTVAGSTSFVSTTNVETKWIAMSAGAATEIVKISSQALG